MSEHTYIERKPLGFCSELTIKMAIPLDEDNAM